MRAHLTAHGVAFDECYVPLTGMSQIFVTDPNGVVIELLFDEASDEAARVFGEEEAAC